MRIEEIKKTDSLILPWKLYKLTLELKPNTIEKPRVEKKIHYGKRSFIFIHDKYAVSIKLRSKDQRSMMERFKSSRDSVNGLFFSFFSLEIEENGKLKK